MAFTKKFNQEHGEGVLLYGVDAEDGVTPRLIYSDESGALIIVDHIVNENHQGGLWSAGHLFSGVADNGTVELLIKASANEVHSNILISSGGDALFQLYEGPTLGGNGTAITILNYNRQHVSDSPTVSTNVTAFHTPTHNSPQTYGTQISPIIFLPGGVKNKASGVTAGVGSEQWILAQNTDYLIKLTNISGAAQYIFVDVTFHEH